MEGFLRKKARGEKAVFTTNKWKRKWCELNGGILTYYEDFDQKKDQGKGKPTDINVVGGTVQGLKRGTITDHEYCFIIKLQNGKTPLTFETDKTSFKGWIESLTEAVKTPEQILEEERKRKAEKPDTEDKYLDLDDIQENLVRYFNLLNLDPDDPNSKSIQKVKKSYKRMALKHHPDKGGDQQMFDDLNRANICLCHLIHMEELEAQHKSIEFNCSLIKGPPGEGLGIAIAEIKDKKILQVKEIMSCINIIDIDPIAGDSLEEKDVMIGIGSDNVEGWPLKRIVSRVGNFRCPVGAPVRLRFRRKVKKEEFEIDSNENKGYASPTEDEVTTPRSNVSTPKGYWRSDTNVHEEDFQEEGDVIYLDASEAFDLDQYSYDSRFSQTMSTNFSETVSTTQGSQGLSSTMNTTATATFMDEKSQNPQSVSSNHETTSATAAQMEAMQQEIASLKEKSENLTKENVKRKDAMTKLNALQRTLDFTQKEVREISAVRQSLKESRQLCAKLDEDKKKLKKEVKILERKNEKLVIEIQTILLNAEEYMQRKKENSVFNQDPSNNRFEQTKKHIQNVKKVRAEGALSDDSIKNHIFACTKAIDGGASMRKWQAQGKSADDKLNEFHQKLSAAGIIKTQV